MTSYDIAVIGGGAVGLAISYLAAKRGMKVALIERHNVLSGATGFSAGIVTAQLSLEQDIRLAMRTIEVLEEVETLSEVKFMEETGFVTVEPRWMAEETARSLASQGVNCRLLDREGLQELVPVLLTKDHEMGVYTGVDRVVDLEGLGRAYSRLIDQLGVKVYSGNRITGVRTSGDSIEDVQLNGTGSLRADNLVFAAGPWNRPLLSELGIYDVPTVIYKCQVVKLRIPEPRSYVPFYVSENHLYMRREFGRTSLAGNGYSRVVDRAEGAIGPVEPEYVYHIVDLLSERLRRPEGVLVDGGWAGPCSSTYDGMPLVGRVPGTSNCFVVDGLDGYGLMRSAGVAELLLEAVVYGREAEWASPSRRMALTGESRVVELHSV
ncbi:MAG: FAD-binding oxidoreductase [Candidatus Caldarchaeales archaeon]